MIVGILHVLYSDLKGTATAVYVDKGLVPVLRNSMNCTKIDSRPSERSSEESENDSCLHLTFRLL